MKRLLRACFAVVVIVACGDSRDRFDDGVEGTFDTDAGSDGSPPASCEGQVRCSRDLHAIVDACDETRIMKTCAPDEACGEGSCRPACDGVVSANASTGCEFVALPPPPEFEIVGSCFAAFIANTWETGAKIEAEFDGAALDLVKAGRIVRADGANVVYAPFSGEIQPGEVAVLFLSQTPSGILKWTPCPEGVSAALPYDTAKSGTKRSPSFRIKTSAPVSAYSIYPYGGASSYAPSASLLLPIAAWKTDYVVTNPWEAQRGTVATAPTTSIVAAEDDTEITLVGSVHIQGNIEVEGAEKGVPHTYRLKRGEHLQFGQDQELTGTRIASNKKIGVWTGHDCMAIPTTSNCCCDSTQLELLPVPSWGRSYAVVPYLSRRNGEIAEEYGYRLTGAVDGTVLTYEPSQPAGAPPSLSAGESVLVTTRDPFVVTSQDAEHPFAVYAYMTGNAWANAEGGDGDPDFTFVVPTEQYLDHYVFFVDPSYRNSQIVVVRSREDAAKEFAPVTLDCAGPLDGWQPLGTSGKHEYTRIRLTKDFAPQKVGSGTCAAGRHELDSRAPVAVTVWGTDAYASYSYPGGAAIRTLNTVQVVVQ